jgi:tRNA threonylcarbamoyladenosine biosynthesis protein TsaB
MASARKNGPAGIVLGIETATSRGSVAICREGELLGELILANPRSHSEKLLPAVELLLASASMSAGDLAAVAVSAGPGSFTGLRIGVAAAKGLAFSRAIPLYGIPSLQVLAANASPGVASVCAVIDARRGEVFSSLNGEEAKISAPIDLAASLPGGTLVLGDIPPHLADLLRGRRKDGVVLAPAHQNTPRAAVVALLGAAFLSSGKASEAESLVPFYLRPSDAEANRSASAARRRKKAQRREKAC